MTPDPEPTLEEMMEKMKVKVEPMLFSDKWRACASVMKRNGLTTSPSYEHEKVGDAIRLLYHEYVQLCKEGWEHE